MIVRAQHREQRIEQARLLRAQDHGVDAVQGAEAAGREALVRLAGLLERLGQPDLQAPAPAALEHAERVAGHAQLPVHERHQRVEHALLQRLFRRRGGNGLQDPRLAVRPVALADDRVLAGEHAVVVGRGPVEEPAVGHQALGDVLDFAGVARPAGLRGRAQVAGVDEAHEGEVFVQDRGVGALGVGRRLPDLAVGRLHVGLLLRGLVLAGARRPRHLHARVAAVAVRAAEAHGGGDVHRLLVRLGVAAHAAGALGVGLLLALGGEAGRTLGEARAHHHRGRRQCERGREERRRAWGQSLRHPAPSVSRSA
jgi:hypothetical protein